MSDQVQQNKATVTRMLERLSAGDISGFTEALGPHYVRHSQAMPPALQEIRGRAAMHQWLASNLAPFPDYREELEWLDGEGDFVAWRSRGRGTRSGPFGPFHATRRSIDVVMIGIHRFEGGFVAETWTSCDNRAVPTQPRLMPGK